MFSERLVLNNNTKQFPQAFAEAGFKSACINAERRSVIGRTSRQSPATTGRLCNDPDDTCVGGDRGCCCLVYGKSGGCRDQATDLVLGGVGSRQRIGGAFKRLHHQNRNSNEI